MRPSRCIALLMVLQPAHLVQGSGAARVRSRNECTILFEHRPHPSSSAHCCVLQQLGHQCICVIRRRAVTAAAALLMFAPLLRAVVLPWAAAAALAHWAGGRWSSHARCLCGCCWSCCWSCCCCSTVGLLNVHSCIAIGACAAAPTASAQCTCAGACAQYHSKCSAGADRGCSGYVDRLTT